jgi:tape measure domain-containing protein
MAKAIETLKIAIDFQDKGSQAVIEKLKNSLQQLERGASGAKPRIASLRKEILAQGNASVKSVANINAQSTALKALRDEAKIGGRAFNQLTKDIAKLDAQMGKAGKTTQGRRGGARQATQIAGAVISGGIFGGPEGALGAAGGAALGGVEGAFAGAAIGAQVGAFREALGASADYAAEIGKLQIALKGVTDVQGNAEKSQANYSEALEAAAEATRDYNVPQGAAIRGITRLTAAVTGAGGPVADAATTFQNVTAAIKATGGSTEDVRGAITAMVQVFSKGKVSAEELSGQLGERLPGAVTLFAKANKMTLPELQKNLKAGTVGLNELMNFIRQLGVEFDDTAKTIASSNEEAGARLTVAFDNMKLGVGNALKDTGAELQNAFGRFIEEITPKAIEAAKNLAKALKPVIDNLDLVVATLVGLAAGAVIGAVVKGIMAMVAAVKTATTVVGALTAVMALNPIFAGALAVGGIVAGIVAINKAINGQADALERVKKAGAAEGATGAQKAEAISTVKQQISEQETIIGENQGGRGARERAARLRRRQAAERELDRLKKQLADITRVRKTEKEDGEPFKYKPVTDDDKDGDSKAAKALQRRRDLAAEITRKLRDALAVSEAQNEVEELLAKQSKERSDLQAKFAKLQKDGVDIEIKAQEEKAKSLLFDKQMADASAVTNKLGQKSIDNINRLTEKIKQKFQSEKEYKRLLSEGISPEIAKQIVAINEQFNIENRILQQRLLDLQAKVSGTDLSDKERKILEEQVRLIKEKMELLGEAAEDARNTVTNYDEEKNSFESFKEAFEAGIQDMGNLYENLGAAAANAFSGMADVVADFVTTGTANFKEFAASVLSDLARIFTRMAFFQAFKGFGLFGNGGVVGKGTTPPTTLPGSVGAVAAKGLAVGKNKIMPFARGGIVTKPTFFKYASGGAGNFGLMGEAGPEAIMPLRRGRNGKLGVESSGGVGNVVVNVDASGSNVQGDQPNAKALGSAIGAAVQAELIKQKRPGGLLS